MYYLTIFIACWATLVHGEDLLQVYALAKENDPVLHAARLEYEAVAYGVEEARAGLLPSLGINYTKTKIRQDILSSDNAVFAVGSASYPQSNLGLTLAQPVFRLGAWFRLDQAHASERVAAAVYASAEQDLILRVATSYLDILSAQNALSFSQAERDSIQNQLILARKKFESGQATMVSLSDAQARAALNESNIIFLENELADKVQALREITGTEINQLRPLEENFRLMLPEPLDLNSWLTGAQDNNTGIRTKFEAIEVARDEIKKQQAAYAPTLDLTYNIDKNNTGGSLFGGGSDVKTNNIALRLNIPIFDGGVTHAVSHAAAKRHEESKDALDKEKRQVERATRYAYNGIVGGVQRVAALEKSVESLEQARSLKEEGYKSGLGTLLGVLDAERDLYAAKRDAAQARYNYVLNRLKLKQAIGALTDQDLVVISDVKVSTPP